MEKMHLSVPLHGEYLQQGEGKHTWKFTASCGAPFSQKSATLAVWWVTSQTQENTGEGKKGENWGLWVFKFVKNKSLDSVCGYLVEKHRPGVQKKLPQSVLRSISAMSVWGWIVASRCEEGKWERLHRCGYEATCRDAECPGGNWRGVMLHLGWREWKGHRGERGGELM